ncbi:MAG: sigma 54-interacting transcriptional regulator [Candidatus Cyclobacteriaceae bacterium M3_2C_046]
MRDQEILSIKQRFEIIGNSPLLNHAIEIAAQVAPTDMTVLITGESGTGKESFSKIIHQLSTRKHGQFIAINCGAIPEGTIDSELFGHEKGSFTGAHETRKGYFEVTNGGTIFLDEIAEMPLNTQSRLLRVLEYGEFIKVGSSKVQKTDVRIVAATNKNLLEAVGKGKFREDLYYRLNTVPIFVPPLRDRSDDMLLLFRKFASDYAERYRTKPIYLTESAKITLMKYRFPGNIRQLKNLVEQMSVLELEREVDSEKLLKYLPQENSLIPALYKDEKSSTGISERDLLYKVLFDMKKDVNELKKLVNQMLKNGEYSDEMIEESQQLFTNLDQGLNKEDYKTSTYLLEDAASKPYDITSVQPEPKIETSRYNQEKEEEIEDITHETENDESLSIEKKEKELIVKALRKNNNKRKYAAQDLGISERTLYRKIKQYELENS